MSTKNFSDTDAGAIISRATELHGQAGLGTQLSLADIEHIAAEMGVPAEHVRTAAREHQASPISNRGKLLAIPPIRTSATLSGPVDDERWAAIVHILRRHLGGGGETESIGSTRYWHRSIHDMGSEISRNEASVRMHAEDAVLEITRTGVPIVRVMLQIFGAIAGGGIFAVLLSVGDVGPLVGMTGLIAGAAAGATGVRLGLRAWTRRQIQRLADLALHIEEATRVSGSENHQTPLEHDLRQQGELDTLDLGPEGEQDGTAPIRERA